MAAYGFQLGILPERKINKRAMVTSYGLVTMLLLIAFNAVSYTHLDRKSTRLNSSHPSRSRMPSSA